MSLGHSWYVLKGGNLTFLSTLGRREELPLVSLVINLNTISSITLTGRFVNHQRIMELNRITVSPNSSQFRSHLSLHPRVNFLALRNCPERNNPERNNPETRKNLKH